LHEKGLNNTEVEEARKKFGPNELKPEKQLTWFTFIIRQFSNPFILILLAVGIISLVLDQRTDAIICFAVALINISIGFFQEYSAHKTLQALKNIIKPTTTVVRDGKRQKIEVKYLVPGDVVALNSGDKVPADGILYEGFNVLAKESILTGEQEAVNKQIDSHLFMGTTILSGRGFMRVTAIGEKTEIGQISEKLESIKDTPTPLQNKFKALIRYLTLIILVVCMFIFVYGIVTGENIWDFFRLSIVLSVAAIPEGLPIAITVILALGMRRILKRQGLVKQMLAIETLGSTTVICTDKTGTLTEGKMQVVDISTSNKEKFFLALNLVNDQNSNIEIALWEYLENQNINPEQVFKHNPRIGQEPFDSDKKHALSVHQINGKDMAFMLGAPEIIADFCKEDKKTIETETNKFAQKGFRVLGVAYKEEGELVEKNNFSWLGLVAIEDPLRTEVKASIKAAQAAGIKIKMITGDYRITAENIARELDLPCGDENVLEGEELDRLETKELARIIENITIFTRVKPLQKLKIIEALQLNDEIVAMTGDGVNDAPALKQADIGVVVGSATDVAKEASDLILLDNNFKTIVAACEEGRVIFSNIKKVVGYTLANSFAQIFLIFGSILLNLPIPLTIVQVLWIQLICDGPPDIILGFEPKEKDIMSESPQKLKKETILSMPMIILAILISLFIGLISLYIFQSYQQQKIDLDITRTTIFAIVCISSLVYLFSFKNLKKTLIHSGHLLSNLPLIFAVIYGFLLTIGAIYIPFLNKILDTKPLGYKEWLIVIAISLMALTIVETIKYININFRKKSI